MVTSNDFRKYEKIPGLQSSMDASEIFHHRKSTPLDSNMSVSNVLLVYRQTGQYDSRSCKDNVSSWYIKKAGRKQARFALPKSHYIELQSVDILK